MTHLNTVSDMETEAATAKERSGLLDNNRH